MKTKKAKTAKKTTAKAKAAPVSKKSAAEIIGALKVKSGPVSTVAPVTTRSHAVDPKFAPAPAAAPTKDPSSFSDMYHARGGRLWFQVVATPELRAKVEMLKAKAGARTLNDLAAKLFDEAFARYGI